jgi:hypothetical protein
MAASWAAVPGAVQAGLFSAQTDCKTAFCHWINYLIPLFATAFATNARLFQFPNPRPADLLGSPDLERTDGPQRATGCPRIALPNPVAAVQLLGAGPLKDFARAGLAQRPQGPPRANLQPAVAFGRRVRPPQQITKRAGYF